MGTNKMVYCEYVVAMTEDNYTDRLNKFLEDCEAFEAVLLLYNN